MSAPREQIMAALLAKLQGAYAWGVVGRRNRAPSAIAAVGKPALILLKHHQHYSARALNMPSVRTLHVMALVYIDVGADETAIPDSVLNPIMDAMDAALAPDTPQGFCTLGGLVQSAKITGEVTEAPGDVTGKGLAIIPIDIVIP